MTIADVLRKAIKDSGKSANELAKMTGVPQPTISEFLRGRDIRLSRAQELANHLGIEAAQKQAAVKPKRVAKSLPKPASWPSSSKAMANQTTSDTSRCESSRPKRQSNHLSRWWSNRPK